ncbi:hypothetical protein COHA_003830 [Chlorella ohadii]|uniref:Amino acid transporter transmembrane domain-containing protein n=1 Tax=Chlorella ohadii TaxID=2649997 RepID=A0AAD5DUF7_9CHLO|nr:hypothetical protein COHA_003830 [Chlorella ohadii]
MKSPFDVDDVKMDASNGSGPVAVIDLEARPSALGSGLSQRLSALGQNLSQRISYLSHQMDEHGLSRISAVKVLTDDKDTVTEPGRAGWIEVTLHLVTVMFGAGVLGLPYAMASQGWALGLCMLALATGASAYSAFLLAELHTLRDGRRVRTLRALGEEIWGKRGRRWIVTLQLIDMASGDGWLVGGSLIYTVVGGTSLMNIINNCTGANGAACDQHAYKTWPWTLCFGGAMILLSQFPDFHALTIVSFVGAIMPIVYAAIAFISILTHGKVENVDYSMIQKSDTVGTVMNVLSGIGAMYYAYGGQVVQNEVTAMVKAPPKVIQSMRKALSVTYIVIGISYFAVAIAGFAMFGNTVTGNVLQSLSNQGAAIAANIAVLLHVGAAFQAFSMTVYLMLEEQVMKRNWLPKPIARRPWVFRFTIRTIFVCVVTFFAALIPFFNQLSGLKGGACMVPLCFIIPVALWSSYNKGYKASKARLLFNYALIAVLAAIALVATVGSVYKIIKSASTFQVFA